MRGRGPLFAGIGLLAAAVALVVVGAVLAFTQSTGAVKNFSRVALADGTGTISFAHAGDYVAYYESPSITDETDSIPLVPTTLTNVASGDIVTLSTKYGNRADGKISKLTYSVDGHHGAAMWQFHINAAGSYRVEMPKAPSSDAVVAFGPSVEYTGLAGGLLILLGIVIFVAGAVLLIVGLVKRSRHKGELRRLAYYGTPGNGTPGYGTPGYGTPGYGAPPPYGQAPYGQAPYGQAPYGQAPPPSYWNRPPE